MSATQCTSTSTILQFLSSLFTCFFFSHFSLCCMEQNAHWNARKATTGCAIGAIGFLSFSFSPLYSRSFCCSFVCLLLFDLGFTTSLVFSFVSIVLLILVEGRRLNLMAHCTVCVSLPHSFISLPLLPLFYCSSAVSSCVRHLSNIR